MKDCYDCSRYQSSPVCTMCNDWYEPFSFWNPIPCPICSGRLSGVRWHNGRPYRHCYACHMEFPVDGSGRAYREETP